MVERNSGRKAALERLKKHSNQRRKDIDAKATGQSVARETDRGSVILLGAIVEDALQEKIEERFGSLNADENERLFGPDAPIGSFSAKIRLAQALEIIDRETATICHVLREMRNACAHSRNPISFADEVLRDAARVIFRAIANEPENPKYTQPDSCRRNLVVCVHYLCRLIDTGDKGVAADHTNEALFEVTGGRIGSSPEKRK